MTNQKAHLVLLMPAFNEILKMNNSSINIVLSEIYSMIYKMFPLPSSILNLQDYLN